MFCNCSIYDVKKFYETQKCSQFLLADHGERHSNVALHCLLIQTGQSDLKLKQQIQKGLLSKQIGLLANSRDFIDICFRANGFHRQSETIQ